MFQPRRRRCCICDRLLPPSGRLMHIARNQTLGDTCPTPLAVAAKQMVWHRATSGKTGVRGGERIWAGSQLNINSCRAAGAQKEGRWEVPRCSALLRSVDSTVRTKGVRSEERRVGKEG